MLGIFKAFTPKFVKVHANLAERTIKAMEDYVKDVEKSKYPEEKRYYKMTEKEFEKLMIRLR